MADVYIENFRSIKNITVNFEPRCRMFVGVNESGKSNILAALSHLDFEKKIEPGDLRESGPDEDPNADSFIRFKFKFSSEDISAIASEAEKSILSLTPEIGLYKTKSLDTDAIIRMNPSGLLEANIKKKFKFCNFWSFDKAIQLNQGFFVPLKSCPDTMFVTTLSGETVPLNKLALVHFTFVNDEQKKFLREATNHDLWVLIGSEITAFVKDNLPACVYWRYDEKNLLPSQVNASEFITEPSKCEPLRQMFALAGFPDVAKAFSEYDTRPHGRRNLLEKVSHRANEHLQNVWSEYSNIRIDLSPNGEFIDASIRDKHNYFSMSMRSDGFKRFISFLLLVSAKVKSNQLRNVLYVHDEPDLGLHPSGIKYLRDELLKISQTNWVAVSTHSIFMVDKERIERHVIVRKRDEITELVEITASNIKDEEVIYNALGFSIYEELRPFNLIFEGWRDKRLFKQFGEMESEKNRKVGKALHAIGLCHAKGVKDVGRVVDFLDLANRSYAVITDSDAPAIEQRNRFLGSKPGSIWKSYADLSGQSGRILTAEDFIEVAALDLAAGKVCSDMPGISFSGNFNWSDAGVMADVKAGLVAVNCTPEQIRDFSNRFKAVLFDSGEVISIRPSYKPVFDAILELSINSGAEAA